MGFGDFLNNVVNSIPVVGHVKGLGHAVFGDHEGAREAIQAANSCTSGVLNSIPVVGHAKGLLHSFAGDRKGAAEAYLSATRSSLVMGGAVVAGPAGAAAAAVMTGVGTDAVVSVATGERVGYIKNVDTILGPNKGVTDRLVGVVKMALDVGCDVAAGSAGGAISSAVGFDVAAGSAGGAFGSAVGSDVAAGSAGGAFSSAARIPGKQVINLSSKQITQAVQKTVVRNLENQVVGYALDNRTNIRGRRFNRFIDEDEEEFGEDIYFFQFEENLFKVGRTGNIAQRLQTHERKYDFHFPWAFSCRDSVSAEWHILNDKQTIKKAKIIKVRETEELDCRQVNMTPEAFKNFVLNEIRDVVARVNRGETW